MRFTLAHTVLIGTLKYEYISCLYVRIKEGTIYIHLCMPSYFFFLQLLQKVAEWSWTRLPCISSPDNGLYWNIQILHI